jgi:hypothetical protein
MAFASATPLCWHCVGKTVAAGQRQHNRRPPSARLAATKSGKFAAGKMRWACSLAMVPDARLLTRPPRLPARRPSVSATKPFFWMTKSSCNRRGLAFPPINSGVRSCLSPSLVRCTAGSSRAPSPEWQSRGQYDDRHPPGDPHITERWHIPGSRIRRLPDALKATPRIRSMPLTGSRGANSRNRTALGRAVIWPSDSRDACLHSGLLHALGSGGLFQSM